MGWTGGQLRIRLRSGEAAPSSTERQPGGCGLSISRPLEARLFEAMRGSFGDEIAWS